jgi:hypothetical protein
MPVHSFPEEDTHAYELWPESTGFPLATKLLKMHPPSTRFVLLDDGFSDRAGLGVNETLAKQKLLHPMLVLPASVFLTSSWFAPHASSLDPLNAGKAPSVVAVQEPNEPLVLSTSLLLV